MLGVQYTLWCLVYPQVSVWAGANGHLLPLQYIILTIHTHTHTPLTHTHKHTHTQAPPPHTRNIHTQQAETLLFWQDWQDLTGFLNDTHTNMNTYTHVSLLVTINRVDHSYQQRVLLYFSPPTYILVAEVVVS